MDRRTVEILLQSACPNSIFELCFLVLILALLVSLFAWCCVPDDHEQNRILEHSNQSVIAAEVRPGLIVVQNSPSTVDTLRIIQEYNAIQGYTSPGRFPQCAAIAEAANTKASYQQRTNYDYMNLSDNSPSANAATEELHRPPPYVPGTTHK